MQLAVVVGQVVASIRCDELGKGCLLIVDFIDTEGKSSGERHVAADPIGAGNGEWVLVVAGSSARKTVDSGSPIDLGIVAIVDQVIIQDQISYRK